MQKTTTALIVAHPGHELRVHRWLETERPVTFVLTQGDGTTGVSRLASTTRVLRATGASIGSVYGSLEDRAIYTALLRQDHALFCRILDDLVQAFVALDVHVSAGDEEDGYNPTHDVCRYLTTAAVARASQLLDRPIRNLEFSLVGAPDACPNDLRSGAVWLHLDAAAFERKLAAARSYPELRSEVDAAIANNGVEAFRVECLRPVSASPEATHAGRFYERHGERQVAAGLYADVIRYDAHVRPVKEAIWRHARLIPAGAHTSAF